MSKLKIRGLTSNIKTLCPIKQLWSIWKMSTSYHLKIRLFQIKIFILAPLIKLRQSGNIRPMLFPHGNQLELSGHLSLLRWIHAPPTPACHSPHHSILHPNTDVVSVAIYKHTHTKYCFPLCTQSISFNYFPGPVVNYFAILAKGINIKKYFQGSVNL